MNRTMMQRIGEAMIASCTCMTKTNEPQFHKDNCRYKVLQDCFRELMLCHQREQEELRFTFLVVTLTAVLSLLLGVAVGLLIPSF